MNRLAITLILGCLTAPVTALAGEAKAVIPDKMFSDNMVIQCSMKAPVWGRARPGEKVTVEFSPGAGSGQIGQKLGTTTDKDGKWMLRLKPLKAGNQPGTLTISGNSGAGPVVFANVLVGEVWLGSGQSNMALRTSGCMRTDPVLTRAVRGGGYPSLRIYVNAGKRSGWRVAEEQSIRGFSALLFSFGHALNRELKVPVGLFYGAAGGTPSGRWLTEEMASAHPGFMKMFREKTPFRNFAEMYAKRDQEVKATAVEVAKAKAEARKPRWPRRSVRLTGTMGDLYARHVKPYAPYGIRGVLWDQGETGTHIPGIDQFTTMNALISGWRRAWNQPPSTEGSKAPGREFFFLHVQKPSGGGCAWDYDNPVNRLAKKFSPLPKRHARTTALKYPLDHIRIATIRNAPIVTTSDLAPGVHPPTKYGYGKRACRVALGTVYGRDVATCGPVYRSHKVEDGTIRVAFNNVGKGLAFRHGQALQGFEVAAADGNWKWAGARIDGNTIIVSSKQVPRPVSVRYAFSERRQRSFANLFNKDGLPALIFTSVQGTPAAK
jgi:sialate O-acetylesterase